jgi:2-polyprenyl-6-methoxyphenol hydroxylase-like FAD-dependent oxidoreductase
LQLQFANGHQTSVGLLIGADGIFSVLLDLLDQDSPLRPFFEVSLRRPLNFQHLTIVNGIAPTRGHPLLHQRRFQTLDGTTRLFVMPFAKVRPAAAVAALPNASDFTHFPEDMTMWQMSFVSSLATARQFAQDTPALFAEITERCRHWHDPVPRLLAETPPSLCLAAPVYDRDPLPHHPGQGLTPPTTTPRPWVTFIGDAAHAMCPFKAQGANQALVDAMELAQALTGGGEAAPEQALARFEEQMIVRTGPKVVESRRCAVEFHQPANVSVDFFAGLRGLKTTKSIVETCRRQGIGANISSVEQLDSFISNIFRSQE